MKDDRLISLNAAIDALNGLTEIYLNNLPPTIYKGDAIIAIKALPSAQPEPQWIPCSERLPEGITQVIIQTNGEAIHEAIYMGKDDYGHYVWKRPDNEIYWDEEVVAWMPLPTPYQPKEDICK